MSAANVKLKQAARPLRILSAGLTRSAVAFAAALTLSTPLWAADLIIDNGGPGFSVVGDWPTSTAVAGYEGTHYQTHIANGPVPSALTVDNTDAGFSVTGDWPLSTAVTGYLGANYRTHAANGPRPGSLVIDNPQATASGTWPTSTSVVGYQGSNYQAHAAGTGTDSITWALAGSGQYRVYARWTSQSNRASNARYIVSHSGGDTEISVNQKLNGSSWQLLGTFDLDTGSHITLSDAGDGYVIADAVMAEPVNAQANTASWELPIATPGSYRLYARWSAHPNRASNARYTITHSGGDTEISVNQQQNSGSWQLLGSYALAPGQARVALTDEADGYVIADALMVVPDTAPTANSATWTPTLTQAGRYDVYAKWPAHPNRASDARYSISHTGGTTDVTVNQQQNGGAWQLLGQFDLAPGQAAITLTDAANGYVIADAIRLSNVGPQQASLYYIQADHLGTPRLITDENNTVVWRHLPTTEPFGTTPPEDDPNATGNHFEMPLAFPGQYRDRESNLSYNYFRDYDPATGAYVQSDPIGLQGGINTYSYVKGNPVRYIDPDGRVAWIPVAAGIGATIGAVSGAIAAGNAEGWNWNNASLIATGAAIGGLSGAAAGLTLGTGSLAAIASAGWVGAIAGGLGNLGGQVASNIAKGKPASCIDARQVGYQAMVGGFAGLVGGAAYGPYLVPNADATAAAVAGLVSTGINAASSTNLGGAGVANVVQ